MMPVKAFLIITFIAVSSFAKSDLETMNEARKLYGVKNYDKAIETYSSISKSSDYWPMAVEERAHTYGKKGEYNKAIADFTTLFSSIFEKSLGPEPYFTAALTYLKLCQYAKVNEVMLRFKTNMKPRILALEKMSKGEADALIFDSAVKLRKEYSSNAYAKNSQDLPLLFHLDAVVKEEIKKENELTMKLTNRMAALAKRDLADISFNLKRMQLVDAEVIQRLRIAEKAKDEDRKEVGKIEQKDMQLKFPYDPNEREVWIDEPDNYQVEAKGCPQPAPVAAKGKSI